MKNITNKILINSLIIALSLSFLSCDAGNETATPELTINPESIIEGNEGITTVQISVTTSSYLAKPIELIFSTNDGSARSGTDYTGITNGSLVIPAGSSSGTINIEILTDEVMEFNEVFSVVLSNSGEFLINTNKVGITIIDDDDESYVIQKDAEGFITPDSYPEMQLVWSDEFDGPSINTNDWTFEIGDGCPNVCGWGNNELEIYTDKEENSRIMDGRLIITAIKGAGENNYTSARMITKGKQEFQYGRIDIRAKLPEGQGIWPAIWMLGSNIDQVGWPSCGEIDIMELVGHLPETSHGTAHYNENGHKYKGSSYVIQNKFSEEFHVFSIFWDNNIIRWYVDYNKFFELGSTDVGSAYPFNDPFFFIMNIAVGGNWPGDPDATTFFPQEMQVDYVRVFQLAEN